MAESEDIKIIGADTMKGRVLIHFSDGSSVLYQAHFLHDVRNDDGNVAIPSEAGDDAKGG